MAGLLSIRRRFLLGLCAFFLAPLVLLGAVPNRAKINGVDCVSLQYAAKSLGFKAEWVRRGEVARMRDGQRTVTFEIHRREVLINGLDVHLGHPIAESRDTLWLSVLDLERTLRPILQPAAFRPAPPLRRIIIDAGHGGKDPGAQNPALRVVEKQVALDVAVRLQKLLNKAGFDARLTRADDRFIELEQRPALANKAQGDLFVSIHFNALKDRSVRGVETFVFTPRNQPSTNRSKLEASDRRDYPANANDPWNALVGFMVQRELASDLGSTDRGLKRARFTVLRDLSMPGLLIEGGFVTHPGEGAKIATPAYRQQLAQSIAEGILAYQRTLSPLRSPAKSPAGKATGSKP